MNLVDSSAWLAYFANNANAKHFAPIIEDTAQLIVPTIILTEVFKVVSRQQNEDTALQIVAHIKQGKLIALSEKIALDAAAYGLQYRPRNTTDNSFPRRAWEPEIRQKYGAVRCAHQHPTNLSDRVE